MPTTEFQEVKYKVSIDADERKIKTLNKLGKTLETLSKVNIDSEKFDKLISSLSRIGDMNLKGSAKHLDKMANSLKAIGNVTKQLDDKAFSKIENLNFNKSANSVNRLTDSIKDLSSASKTLDVSKAKIINDDVPPAIPQTSTLPALPEQMATSSKPAAKMPPVPQTKHAPYGRISQKFEDWRIRRAEKAAKPSRLPNQPPEVTSGMKYDGYAGKASQAVESKFGGVSHSIVNGFTKMAHGVENVMGKVVNKVTDAFDDIPSKIKPKISALGNAVKSGLKSAFSGAGKVMVAPFTATMNKLSSGIKSFAGKFHGLLRIMANVTLYRAAGIGLELISDGFKEGIENLYKWDSIASGSFQKTMDSLATSMQYLKNSFGALVAPLLQAVAPAIEYITDKVVECVNWFNQLISSMTGKTSYYKALRKPAEYTDNYADAMDEAAESTKKAQKEAKKWILGFDEINRLGSNKDNSSTSGKKDAADKFKEQYDGMFEEVPIESNVSDLADRIKQSIENQDWKGLGTLLGNKVNDAVNSIPFGEYGKKFGEGMNAIVQTGYWTLKTIDFNNIGAKGAEFCNEFMRSFDFEYLGRFLVRGVTGCFDTLIGFFTNLDFGLVAKSISDFFLGVYREANEWIESIDWGNLGLTMYNQIKAFLTNIDWSGLTTEMFRLLGNTIRGSVQFLCGFFGGIWDDVAAWWARDIKADTFSGVVSNLWKSLTNAIGNVGNWVKKNVIDPFMNALIGKENWDKCQKEIQKRIDQIKKPFKALKRWIDNLVQGWQNFWNGVANFFGFGGRNDNKNNNVDLSVNYHANTYDPLTRSAVDGKAHSVNSTVSYDAYNISRSPMATAAFNGETYQANATANVSDKNTSRNKQFGSMYETGSVKTSMNTNISTTNKAGTATQKALIDDGKVNGSMPVGMTAVNNANTNTTKSLISNGRANAELPTSINPNINTSSQTTSELLQWGSATGNFGVDVHNRTYSNINRFLTGNSAGVVDVTMRVTKRNSGFKAQGGQMYFTEMATGGSFHNGRWHEIPQYARGTLNAGSMFVAGEAGPELVGHIGSRTEVLNQSQLGSVMYNSVQRAMKAFTPKVSTDGNVEGILLKILEAIRVVAEKDYTTEITSGDIQKAFNRKAVRTG